MDAGGPQVTDAPVDGQPPKVGLLSSSLPCVFCILLRAPHKPCFQRRPWWEVGSGPGLR